MQNKTLRRWPAPLLSIALAACANPDVAPEVPSRPNVVLILADDMGVASVGAYHPDSGVPTPNIDALAAAGVRFTDAHSGSAVCSPTRYGLLTGRYAWRTRLKAGIVNKWEGPLIAPERLTIADLLRAEGYRTACIGKWHLGWDWPDAEGNPTTKAAEIDYTEPIGGGALAAGFDHYYGDDVPNWPPYVWIEDDRALAIPTARMEEDGANGVRAGPMTPGWSLEAVLPALTERCVSYVEEAAAAEEPFFLYFSMTSPHTPINPAPAFQGASGVSKYADFLIETDWAVGEVLRVLDETGVAEDTLVIFVADNGTSPKCDFPGLAARGVDLRADWRGHKADVWEGGHRVPFVVRWPRAFSPGTRDETVSLVDAMGTVADAVGIALPDDAAEDSVSLLPLLRNDAIGLSRKGVVTHSSDGRFAIHSDRWKLAFCPGSGGWSTPKGKAALDQGLPPLQLYDMHADPSERTNLVAEHPDVVAALTVRFREIVESGRSTPGAPQRNDGPAWWSRLPWPKGDG